MALSFYHSFPATAADQSHGRLLHSWLSNPEPVRYADSHSLARQLLVPRQFPKVANRPSVRLRILLPAQVLIRLLDSRGLRLVTRRLDIGCWVPQRWFLALWCWEGLPDSPNPGSSLPPNRLMSAHVPSLSITEWKPVTGTLPPLSHEEWMENFNKYKDSPEYRILNSNMTLDEYKFIYFMEWSHRLWGRAIGLTFVLPAIYFTTRRRVTPKVALRLMGIAGMIGFQGFVGWWMVKSGLRDDLFAEPGSHPRVSQYRLTAHLGTAFAVYAAMLWSGLDILRDNRLLRGAQGSGALVVVKSLSAPQLRVFRRLVGLLVAMVFATAMTGGLVAGLDAGLIYNEFPKMGAGYVPPTKEMMDPFYSHAEDRSDLWWRNMLENPTTVQFQHRVMALSTFAAISMVFAYSRFNPRVAAAMPKKVKAGMAGVLHLASLQVLLGIGTLVYMVPTHLAASHQAGALALLTGSIVLGHRVWLPRTAAGIAAKRIRAASQRP